MTTSLISPRHGINVIREPGRSTSFSEKLVCHLRQVNFETYAGLYRF